MPDNVSLEDVTAENWRAVARLQLAEDQKHLLASNVYSIAQSKFDPNARPRAVYAEDKAVGFLMYDLSEGEDGRLEASIYRFMIDRDHQGKGYGRAALAKAIEEIGKIPGIARVSISYVRQNDIAKRFYASFGFVERPSDEGDYELIAELAL